MDIIHSFTIIAAFIQAGMFQYWHLIVKRLQEQNMSNLTIMYYQRYAIIPGFILLLFTFRLEYMEFMLANPLVLLAILFSSAVWMLHVYMKMHVTRAVNSMAFLNAFNAIITLPVYLVIGILINRDLPNAYIGVALIILAIALLIKPGIHHKNNQKKAFAITVTAAIIISLIGNAIDAVNMGAYRYFLQNINATLFGLSLFMFLSMLVITVFFWINPIEVHHKTNFKKHGYWPLVIPSIWTVGTFFEGYSVAAIPIYTLIAIAAFTFLIDLASDLKNRRVHFNIKTIVFVFLVILSTSLSVLSLN